MSTDTIDGVFDPELHEDESDDYEPTPIRNAALAAVVALAAGAMLYWGASAAFWLWTHANG